MKLSSTNWRTMTDADRQTVRTFIDAGMTKTLARANGVELRTVMRWRDLLEYGTVKSEGEQWPVKLACTANGRGTTLLQPIGGR